MNSQTYIPLFSIFSECTHLDLARLEQALALVGPLSALDGGHSGPGRGAAGKVLALVVAEHRLLLVPVLLQGLEAACGGGLGLVRDVSLLALEVAEDAVAQGHHRRVGLVEVGLRLAGGAVSRSVTNKRSAICETVREKHLRR
mgnify:CR=1 FL=1